jgi:hypothetical protein
MMPAMVSSGEIVAAAGAMHMNGFVITVPVGAVVRGVIESVVQMQLGVDARFDRADSITFHCLVVSAAMVPSDRWNSADRNGKA